MPFSPSPKLNASSDTEKSGGGEEGELTPAELGKNAGGGAGGAGVGSGRYLSLSFHLSTSSHPI